MFSLFIFLVYLFFSKITWKFQSLLRMPRPLSFLNRSQWAGASTNDKILKNYKHSVSFQLQDSFFG